MDIEKINKDIFDLGVHNPNFTEEIDERTPEKILYEIHELDKQNLEILKNIKKLL